MSTIGKRLKSLRKQKGITQKELIEIIGINRVTYAQYETDRRKLNYDNLKALAGFFNVTTDYILGVSPLSENKAVNDNFDGCRLRDRRKYKRLSIEVLASMTGILCEDIASYETMQKTPSESDIQKLADALGVSDLHFFIDGVLDIRDIIPDIDNKSLEFIVDPSKYEYIVAAHKFFEDGITPEAMDLMRQALIGVYGQKKK